MPSINIDDLTEEQMTALEEDATHLGMSVSDYVKRRLFPVPVTTREKQSLGPVTAQDLVDLATFLRNSDQELVVAR